MNPLVLSIVLWALAQESVMTSSYIISLSEWRVISAMIQPYPGSFNAHIVPCNLTRNIQNNTLVSIYITNAMVYLPAAYRYKSIVENYVK